MAPSTTRTKKKKGAKKKQCTATPVANDVTTATSSQPRLPPEIIVKIISAVLHPYLERITHSHVERYFIDQRHGLPHEESEKCDACLDRTLDALRGAALNLAAISRATSWEVYLCLKEHLSDVVEIERGVKQRALEQTVE